MSDQWCVCASTRKEEVSKINVQATPYKLAQLGAVLSVINIIHCALIWQEEEGWSTGGKETLLGKGEDSSTCRKV